IIRLLEGSAINEAHRWCDKVQDAYSLRCAPQVHGAARDLLDYVEGTFAVELNAATDNPLVLVEDELLVSNGNFHGQPLAFALDALAMASSELANISERRIERLVNPNLSDGLPAFLTTDGGLNSGFMIPQYVAAALVSENKSLCHPASVDSIPTSAGQEDHVSMGNAAGLKAWQVIANAERALAIARGAAEDAFEQSRSGGRRASRGADRVLRLGQGRAQSGGPARARADPAAARRRRDVARPERQAGRRLPHAQLGPSRPDCELAPRPAVGDLGRGPAGRGGGPDVVRSDDRRALDRHRHAGDPAGDVPDVRRSRGAPLRRARPRGPDDSHGRPGRDGRRSTARWDDGRGGDPLHRGRSLAHRP